MAGDGDDGAPDGTDRPAADDADARTDVADADDGTNDVGAVDGEAEDGGDAVDASADGSGEDASADGSGGDDGSDGSGAWISDAFDGPTGGPKRSPDDIGADDRSPSDFGFDGDLGEPDPGEFGFGDAGGPDEFDEEFESDIPRVTFGVDGLDNMIQGGIPERSLLVAIGGAGTGKTTFGLQFLEYGIRHGETGVFITLEESYDRVVRSAAEKGWPFEEYVADEDLAIIDLDPVEMANSLSSIRNELPRLVAEFGADRLVLDSVSILEMMYDDQATRRTEIYDFTKALKRAGVTTLLTSEASEDNAFASRYGIIEYLTDGVVVLRYVRPEDFRETRLAVEIQKLRDANHSRETKPYDITGEGISVYRQANIF